MKSFYRLAIAASLLLPLPAQAQPITIATDEPVCFMSMAGRMINLNSMCGDPNYNQPELSLAESSVSAPAALTGAALQDALRSASVVYGDAYCESRARGATDRQAGSAAIEALTDYSMRRGVDGQITPAFFTQAEAASQSLCPELQPTGRYD